MKKFGLSTMFCVVFVFCAAAVIASPAQILTTLVSFNGANGANPASSLIQAIDGNFYGTTVDGGNLSCNPPYGCGTVFKMTPSGTLTTVYKFSGGTDGAYPGARLMQATNRNLYGTTYSGGASNLGTVFGINQSGTLGTLYSFSGADGANPEASVIQGDDGNFYGTTYSGGAKSRGTIFRITPRGGKLTTLYSFCSKADCADGSYPAAELVQANDGNFYGTTFKGGGGNHLGTVFKITPSGTLTTLHSFAGSDGANPEAALVRGRGSDGHFYGTTVHGGSYGAGTVFKITLSGTLTTLHSFSGSEGEFPAASLIQAIDGNFYGTATYGGTRH